MTQEFDDAAQDPKDYTKYVWGGIGILVVAMIAFMMLKGQTTPRRSEVETKHILIRFDAADPADRARALELIQSIREKIVSGEESFSAMAAKYSQDPQSGPNGGLVGRSGRGDMHKQYDQYAWTAPIGEISEIVQTNYGYHLIVVISRYISPSEVYEQQLEDRSRDEDVTLPGNDELPAEAPEQ